MTTSDKIEAKDMKRPGRPGKLSVGLIEGVAEHIKAGMPKDRAAALVGIVPSTFYAWQEAGKKLMVEMGKAIDDGLSPKVISEEEGLLLEFSESVAFARAVFMKEGIDKIKGEGPEGYKWLMPRLFREEMGARVEVEGVKAMQLELILPGKVGEHDDPPLLKSGE
jgi:hypothetical protein